MKSEELIAKEVSRQNRNVFYSSSFQIIDYVNKDIRLVCGGRRQDMQNIYIGSFPINGGGVTNKNRDLFDALTARGVKISKIDLNEIKNRKSIVAFFKLTLALLNRKNRFVIGISTGKSTRRDFCQLLYTVNRKSMEQSVLIMMGGNDNNNIIKDRVYAKWMACFRRIYVETEGMRKSLESIGLNNVAVYPNCRFRQNVQIVPRTGVDCLSCVFFSSVQPEKGIDLILIAAKLLPSVHFFVYGRVIDSYKECFEKKVKDLSNVFYVGNFQGSSEDVYNEISKYDVLLLPTRWAAEGVPGILVEGKIAGLAEIVTNHNYNAEIVTSGWDGIILKNNTADELIDAIKQLDNDRTMLLNMKLNSKISSEKYLIENNITDIVNDIGGGYKKTGTLLFPCFSYPFTATMQNCSVLG